MSTWYFKYILLITLMYFFWRNILNAGLLLVSIFTLWYWYVYFSKQFDDFFRHSTNALSTKADRSQLLKSTFSKCDTKPGSDWLLNTSLWAFLKMQATHFAQNIKWTRIIKQTESMLSCLMIWKQTYASFTNNILHLSPTTFYNTCLLYLYIYIIASVFFKVMLLILSWCPQLSCFCNFNLCLKWSQRWFSTL